MSYMKKNRFGQYLAIGDADPWANTSDSSTPATTDSGAATSSVLDSFKNLFGGAADAGGSVASAGGTVVTGGTPKQPSTLTNVGAGIGAFLKNLGGGPVAPAPVYPVQRGMSPATKLALAGGGALLLVVLLTRD